MKSRIHIIIRGVVQGVGFRPFIYKLAADMTLTGYVLNSSSGVFIDAEGEKASLDRFVLKIQSEKPVHAVIQSMEFLFLDPVGYTDFQIRESQSGGKKSSLIMPDMAVCDECLSEMFDPKNRRYLYPFINCTHCGPRFSIIESLPYDRPNTSMKEFTMCAECRSEYENPTDRRFHAQPIACPDCGPHLEVWDKNRSILAGREEAVPFIVDAVKKGYIVALKGLGGYQLVCRADDDRVIVRLRQRKHREEKPFALMFPDMQSVHHHCEASDFAKRLLSSVESPIVLLERKKNINDSRVSDAVAPGNPYLGVMLPYTPLHHLLMRELDIPVIATSGNLSEEPMVIDEDEALTRLQNIADYFLIHNRPIVRHVDDSIVRVIMDREMVMRRARGFAPLPIAINSFGDALPSILAVGGHLKNTIAVSVDENVFISQHIGDLSTQEAYSTFKTVVRDFRQLYDIEPEAMVCDLHPEYMSSKFAKSMTEHPIEIQHHEAHIAACRLENQIVGPALGVAWDGTGYGLDGTVWGGEFFISDDDGFRHIGQFRSFRLPGGEKAVREPRRCAAGILFEIYGERLFTDHMHLLNNFTGEETAVIHQMLSGHINSPLTSSAGRLFDAVASLIGIRQQTTYEGQSAMMLEFAADSAISGIFDFELNASEKYLSFDWQPMIEEILTELKRKVPVPILAAKFHNTLAEMVVQAAKSVGESKVILSGGCFQNAFLLERTVHRLQAQRFNVYWHQRIPTNDGGIAVGQVAMAMMRSRKSAGKTLEQVFA